MDVMIDIETMSSRPNAAIASIGAVVFDPSRIQTETELQSPETSFEMVVDLRDQTRRHFDPDTIYWWLTQTAEARNAIGSVNAVPLCFALEQFKLFCEKHQVMNGWSNGANFDHVIMEDAYRSFNIANPLHFTRQLCHRTIVRTTGVPRPTTVGVGHKALDDAITQAIHLQRCFEYMRKRA